MNLELNVECGIDVRFGFAKSYYSRISDYYSFFNLLSQSSAFGGAEPDDYYTQSWVLHLPEYVKPTYPRGVKKGNTLFCFNDLSNALLVFLL